MQKSDLVGRIMGFKMLRKVEGNDLRFKLKQNQILTLYRFKQYVHRRAISSSKNKTWMLKVVSVRSFEIISWINSKQLILISG